MRIDFTRRHYLKEGRIAFAGENDPLRLPAGGRQTRVGGVETYLIAVLRVLECPIGPIHSRGAWEGFDFRLVRGGRPGIGRLHAKTPRLLAEGVYAAPRR